MVNYNSISFRLQNKKKNKKYKLIYMDSIIRIVRKYNFVFIILGIYLIYLILEGKKEGFIGRNQVRPQIYLGDQRKISQFALSRPSKCFDCEREILEQSKEPEKHMHMSAPGKCFDCESQPLNLPYNEGPTKCFSC